MHTPRLLASFVALCLISLPADAFLIGNTRKDVDRLLVFPGIVYHSPLKGECKFDLHAVALDTDGLAGRSVFKWLCGDDAYFDERWATFRGTASKGSPMSVTMVKDGITHSMDVGEVPENGHMEKTLPFACPSTDLSLDFVVKVEGLDNKVLTSPVQVQISSPEGWGVISDIDDTIKVSQILGRLSTVLSRAFCQEYVPEKGMPELFEYLNKELTVPVGKDRHAKPLFYYVSGSPWQLLSSIQKFIPKHFPPGEIIMDQLNLPCVKKLIHSVDIVEYKMNRIETIMNKFPKRKWLLIGDAGEHDADIYASIYQKFPNRVCHILIRLMEGTNPVRESLRNADERFEEAFKNVPATKWEKLTPQKVDEFIAKGTRDFKNCA